MLGEFFFVSKLSDDCLSVSYMTEREERVCFLSMLISCVDFCNPILIFHLSLTKHTPQGIP